MKDEMAPQQGETTFL